MQNKLTYERSLESESNQGQKAPRTALGQPTSIQSSIVSQITGLINCLVCRLPVTFAGLKWGQTEKYNLSSGR